MNWADLGRALALVLVIEGLLPFAAPARWRVLMLRMTTLDDRELRVIGLGSMIVGTAMLVAIRLFGD